MVRTCERTGRKSITEIDSKMDAKQKERNPEAVRSGIGEVVMKRSLREGMRLDEKTGNRPIVQRRRTL